MNEIVTSILRFGNVEIVTKELREKTYPILKSNKNGRKVWETKIGKTLRILSRECRIIKKPKTK